MSNSKEKDPDHKSFQLTTSAKTRAKSHAQGFGEFFRNQGVVGLAIGFVIGTQARTLVDQLSNSFINPILGLIVGTGDGLTDKKFALTVGGSTAVFRWGAFAFSLINFVIIAVLIYLVYRWLHLDKLDKKK